MRQETSEVLVGGVRCQIVQRDGARMLVRPLTEFGRSLNVSRWIDADLALALPLADGLSAEAAQPIFTPDEIRHLAMVLRQVFYEDEGRSPN